MDSRDEIYLIADELRSIADTGLHYAQNDYDRERYDRALSLSARLVASIEKRLASDVMEEYEGSLPHATPYVGADAAVFRDGRILLIRREDNGLWAMPGGAVPFNLGVALRYRTPLVTLVGRQHILLSSINFTHLLPQSTCACSPGPVSNRTVA